MRVPAAPLLLAALALAGCDRAVEPDRAGAGGEILEGSVSDAMLPYDTVRSQPPLAGPTEAASGRPGTARAASPVGGGQAEGEGGGGGAGAGEPAPRPLETPEATPDAAPPTP